MKKLLSLILILAFLLSFAVINVNAACSLSVSPSNSTVYVGDTFSVSFSFSGSAAVGSADVTIQFDTNKFQYVSVSGGMKSIATNVSGKTIKISDYDATNTSKTYKVTVKFKALTVGSGTVSVVSSDISDTDLNSLGAPTGSTTVSVKQENKSNNANLKWLTVPKGCTLVPKFSKDVTNYTCTVPGSVTSFPMDWEAEDSKATTKVSSGYQLKVGENTRTVTVTAQDGTKKVYTVKITRLAPEVTATPELTPTPTPAPTQEPIKVTVDEQEYTLNPTLSLTLPNGFNKETILYNGTEIEMAVLGGIKLVQLNSEGKDSFFIYDSENGTFNPYKTITNSGTSFTALEEKPDILPDSAVGEHKVINDGEYTVWPFVQFGEGYYIIHIMNEFGVKYPAVYCEADGSIQKLSLKVLGSEQTGANVEITPKPANKFFENVKIDWLLVAIIACALILVAIVVIIIVIASKNSKLKKEQAPKRQWGFDDPYDINIADEEAEETETTKTTTAFSDDDIDFN